MKKICWILLLAAGLLIPVRADDFEDFIQICARVSENYRAAVNAKGSRLDKDFQADLELLDRLSRKNYQVVRKLQLGQDLNFPLITNEIARIYEGQSSKYGVRGADKVHAHSESPEGMFRILADDVKALRKMKFTTEDGGSIQSSLETRRRLLEFRRLVDFFRKYYAQTAAKTGSDPSLLRISQARMMRMDALAPLLMEIARKKYPGSVAQYNLQQEVAQIKKCFEALVDLSRKTGDSRSSSSRSNRFVTDSSAWTHTSGKSRARKKDSDGSRRRIDGLNNRTIIYTEINYSLRNINQQLIRWEQSGFQSDPPLASDDRKIAGDPAGAMQTETAENDYDSMTPKQLDTLLRQRRKEIFRSNTSMDGFDRESERRYLLTLSREQRRKYSDYLRDFQKRGYSSGEAVRNAVLKIHTQMQMESRILPKKEMLQILQALDKDDERRLEKNDIKFKLKPDRSGVIRN